MAPRAANHLFRAFRHRNYRLFFTGQLVSLLGSWIATVASSWLVYRLTQSPFLLGLVAFAGQVPAFFLSPVAGTQVDRFDKRNLLKITQTLSMLESFAMAVLILTGQINVMWIVVLTAFQGAVNALDIPTRQAFVKDMLEEPADLPNAIALNSAMFNSARLVGPAIGGLLIAATNEGICFLIDGFSYLAVLASLFFMRTRSTGPFAQDVDLLRSMKEGFTYTIGLTPVREILFLIAALSLMGTSYMVVLPVIVHDLFHGDSKLLGLFMSCAGLGALTAALMLASRASVLGLGRLIGTAGVVLGAVLCLLAFSSSLPLSMILLFAAGFSFMTVSGSSNTIIQTIVADDKRGRVMSIYAMAFTGMMPIGSLLSGTIAGRAGVSTALAAGGAVCAIATLRFISRLESIRAVARPIYMEKGIIPEKPPASADFIAPDH